MVPGIDPKVDYAFKFLFGREQSLPVLIHLIEAVLKPPPGGHIVQLELLNPFTGKETLDDKLSILDIRARDQKGRQFNVEMQLLPELAFRNRVLYYWARLYSQQLHEGEDYAELRPTISICFVDFVLFPQSPAYHLTFQLRTAEPPLFFCDDLAIHILQLPKFQRSAEELADPLDLWLYFLRHGAQLDSTSLPGTLNVPIIQRAIGDLTMLTQDELERQRYESRLKYQLDERSRLKGALLMGLEQGRAEATAVTRIQMCERMLKRPMTPSETLFARPLDELQRLAEELEKEAFPE